MKPQEKLIPHAIQKKADKTGPILTILGGVHGNETAGVEIVNQMAVYLAMNELKKGIINLIYGNVPALNARKESPGKRFIEKDLNKCFDVTGEPKNREEKRAKELQPVLSATDALIDIHSTIKPSKPFICAPNLQHPYAEHLPLLGFSTVITGEGLLPPDKRPIYSDTYVCSKGGFGMTLETGCQDDVQNIPAIRKGVLKFIQALGIFDEEIVHPFFPSDYEHSNLPDTLNPWQRESEYLEAYANIVATSGFKFNGEWGNFETLNPGTIYAYNNDEPLSVVEKSIMLFPKRAKDIVIGEEACILAREIKK